MLRDRYQLDFNKCFTTQIILICQSSSPLPPSLPFPPPLPFHPLLFSPRGFCKFLWASMDILSSTEPLFLLTPSVFSFSCSFNLFFQSKCRLILSHFHLHLIFWLFVWAFRRNRKKSNLLPLVTYLSCASSIIRALYWSRSGSLG